MHTSLLDVSFLTILNLLVIVLWPASGSYTTGDRQDRRSVLTIIMVILTILVVLLDIAFLVQKLVG